ncbi:MAG TPA: tetratricopeptide repeat protein, partial [Polyangiaceae bacterium]
MRVSLLRGRRARSLFGLGCFFVLATTVSATAWGQFNPEGRKKSQPAATRPAPSRPAPAAPAKSKGPEREALIARYTGVALAQPGAQFPLRRLAELVRERDGNLDKLFKDLERRAEQPGDGGYAAMLALAGLYREDSKPDQAIVAYRRALAQKPKDPAALIALGHMLSDRADQKGAREQFERALPLVSDAAEREQLLRLLLTLSLDLKDYDAAKRHHEELVRRSQGSFHVRGLLGQELLQRGVYDRAVAEYEDLVRYAAGDHRALAPALRDLGRAQAELGNRPAALATLEKALAVSGGQTGIRREVLELIVDVYRGQDRLRELVQKLEREPARDFETLRLLGALYEEIGRIDRAVETYQRALAQNPADLGTRIKLVQLLQIQGELDRAIDEYEALIRAAPQNPDFVFQLAEALIQRGERERALAELRRLEARSREEDVMVALVDFYERVGEKERSLSVLQRLGQTHSTDPTHLVELGSRYWERGEKKKAQQTWERIRAVVSDRAAALHRLGEVYLEHDLVDEALKALRQAIELRPNESRYKKAYAQALERTATGAKSKSARLEQYEQARRIWEELLASSKGNDGLAAEARRHIVTLWSLSGRPELRVAPLERRFGQSPPDVEAGKLLAELELRLGNVTRAEATLRKIVGLAPGDVPTLLSLEQVLVRRRKLDQAIEVLKRLTAAEPRRAREFYQRMAKYAGELYRDDDAMKYAARAVELSPDDAEGHKKLGEMYRQRQDVERAVAAFRRALSKNDRLFPVYFELAELLLSKGENDEADRLLRRVIRASPDEELVARAARLSMQVNLGRGSLEALEKELLPLALANPQRPLYRRLLVEIYGALAFPLVQRAESGSAQEADR